MNTLSTATPNRLPSMKWRELVSWLFLSGMTVCHGSHMSHNDTFLPCTPVDCCPPLFNCSSCFVLFHGRASALRTGTLPVVPGSPSWYGSTAAGSGYLPDLAAVLDLTWPLSRAVIGDPMSHPADTHLLASHCFTGRLNGHDVNIDCRELRDDFLFWLDWHLGRNQTRPPEFCWNGKSDTNISVNTEGFKINKI